jgi:hypothetical protein
MCGDGQCTGREDLESCAEDCRRCGDDTCSEPQESLDNCPEDCRRCGDGTCSDGEDSDNCPDDCG